MTQFPPDIHHGVQWPEAEFLGEWTDAGTVLPFPGQHRAGGSLRAGQTHSVSYLFLTRAALQRKARRRFRFMLRAVLHHHGGAANS